LKKKILKTFMSLKYNYKMDYKSFDDNENALPLLDPPNTEEKKQTRIVGLAKTLKLLAITDIMFNVIFTIFYFNFWYILPIIAAYMGYHGTKTYKSDYILVYGISVSISLIIKFFVIFYSTGWFYLLFNVFSFGTDLFLLTVIVKLITEIRNMDEDMYDTLYHGWEPRNVRFIYF